MPEKRQGGNREATGWRQGSEAAPIYWTAKGGDGGKGQGKGQGKGGGKGYGGGPGPDRRVRSIEEVAEDMLRTLEELKAQQRG